MLLSYLFHITSVPLIYAAVFLTSFFLSVVLTPLARKLALYLNFFDEPGERKIHRRITPYLGGLAMYAAFVMGMIVILGYCHQLTAMVIGATFLVILGLVDDKCGIGPGVKLFGQVLAALLVISSEVCFRFFGNFLLDAPLTIFWIVGITNAVNLLDNMDGLSSGVSAISGAFLFFLAARNGQFLVASLALGIVGVCLGFLRYNFSPASIFMGDAGSLFLGFMLSSTAVKLRLPAEGAFSSFIVPVLVLGLPILDTTLVTILRYANNRPVSIGGKDHCSHRLVALGLSHRQAVLSLYLVAVGYGLCAVYVDPYNIDVAAPIIGVAGVASVVLFAKLSLVPVYGDTGKKECL